MFAESANALFRDFPSGGNSYPTAGHEAVVVGTTADLAANDAIAASPRHFAAQFMKRRPLKHSLPANGSNASSPVGNSIANVVVSLAGDPFCIGTVAALAHKLAKSRNVVVAFAEEAASVEPWPEAFRCAGMQKLPIIYVVQSTSVGGNSLLATKSTLFEDLSLWSQDYEFPAIIAGAADVVAVWRVAQESIQRARNGGGPTLIECRSEGFAAADPLAHMEHYLRKRNAWDELWRQQIVEEIQAEIERTKSAQD